MNQPRQNIIEFISTTEGLRQRNRALVMKAVRSLENANHATITESSRLATGTVSTVLAELSAEGFLVAQEGEKLGRGRPKTQYRANPDAACAAHVRITAEKVTFSRIDFSGKLLDQINEGRSNPSSGKFVEVLRGGMLRLAERANIGIGQIDWVLFTSKALVNQDNSRLLWAPSFGGETIDFDKLFPELDGRVHLSHEACSIAEHRLREGENLKPAQTVLWFGNSIGFGIAERQATGYIQTSAPALAHMNYQADGSFCCCGGRGCVEAHAGFHAILRKALDGPEPEGVTRVVPPAIPLGQMQHIAAKARSGDQLAILAFRDAGRALGNGLSHLFMVTGVMPLLVTGPGVAFFDLIHEALQTELDNMLFSRLGDKVEISFAQQEEALLLTSAIESCIQDLDVHIVATRRRSKTSPANQINSQTENPIKIAN